MYLDDSTAKGALLLTFSNCGKVNTHVFQSKNITNIISKIESYMICGITLYNN